MGLKSWFRDFGMPRYYRNEPEKSQPKVTTSEKLKPLQSKTKAPRKQLEFDTKDFVVFLRLIAGLSALILLIMIYFDTMSFIDYASTNDASAIQITQIYTGGAFKAISVIGGAVALYIFSRFYEN